MYARSDGKFRDNFNHQDVLLPERTRIKYKYNGHISSLITKLKYWLPEPAITFLSRHLRFGTEDKWSNGAPAPKRCWTGIHYFPNTSNRQIRIGISVNINKSQRHLEFNDNNSVLLLYCAIGYSWYRSRRPPQFSTPRVDSRLPMEISLIP